MIEIIRLEVIYFKKIKDGISTLQTPFHSFIHIHTYLVTRNPTPPHLVLLFFLTHQQWQYLAISHQLHAIPLALPLTHLTHSLQLYSCILATMPNDLCLIHNPACHASINPCPSLKETLCMHSFSRCHHLLSIYACTCLYHV
jgi:hypothetical protein